MKQTSPLGLCLATAALLACQPSAATATCIDLGPQRADLPAIAREAVELLRSCGHDPDDYLLGLSQDDRFSSGSPNWTVEFRPRRPERHYPLGVRMEQPCLLRWLEGGQAHPRQIEVMRRVRQLTEAHDLADWKELTVAESARWVGVELRFDSENGLPMVWKILFDRSDLSLLGDVEAGSL